MDIPNNLERPRPINSADNIQEFDCEVLALNKYLKNFALQNHQNGSARTYVAIRNSKVIGYYSLAYGSVSHEEVTSRVSTGLAKHPIPIILLARLAVDKLEKGKNIGKGLLKDALLRALEASNIAGLRAVVVHAKDESAKQFYMKFGFEPSPIDSFHLSLLMKDIRKSVDL